jgi:internalin A
LLPRGEARYAFVHLSFQEYFCACYLDSCIVRPAFIRNKLPDDADVTKQKLINWSDEPYWLETLIFLFELLSAERASEWVDDLADIIFGENIDDISLFMHASELAARIIKNKHIKISRELRDGLAVGIGPKAINEWEGQQYSSEFGALSSLLDTGYAVAIVGGLSNKADVDGRLISGRYLDHLGDVADPKQARVLIIDNVESIDEEELKRFVNVRYLRINGVKLKSSRFLTFFTGLKTLQLMSMPIKDIEPLASFGELHNVQLHNLPILSLAPLSKLKNLYALELHDIKATDVSPLQKLKDLGFLSLKNMKLKELTPLSNIKSLLTLHLEGLPKIDLSPIAALKKLDYLKVADLPVADFGFVSGLKGLSTLDIRRLPIKSFVEIGKMDWLTTMYIISCTGSLAPLEGLAGLRVLGLMNMSTKNIEFICGLKKMRTCYMAENDIQDFTPLSSAESLVSLTIEQDILCDLAPLAACKELRYLDITTESSVDVAPLSQASKLVTFHLKCPSVENLTSLEMVEGLKVTWET